MLRMFLAILVLGAPMVAQAQAEPETISRAEIRTLAPEVIARRVFGILSSTIVGPLVPDTIRDLPDDRPLRWLTGRIRGIESPHQGVCSSAAIFVSFEAAGNIDGERTRVRPITFRTHADYYVIDGSPSGEYVPMNRDATRSARLACQSVDPARIHYVGGESSEHIVFSLRRFNELRGYSVAQWPNLTCLGSDAEANRALPLETCRSILTAITPSQIVYAGSCPSQGRLHCSRVTINVPRQDWPNGAVVTFEARGPDEVLERVEVRKADEPPPLVVAPD